MRCKRDRSVNVGREKKTDTTIIDFSTIMLSVRYAYPKNWISVIFVRLVPRIVDGLCEWISWEYFEFSWKSIHRFNTPLIYFSKQTKTSPDKCSFSITGKLNNIFSFTLFDACFTQISFILLNFSLLATIHFGNNVESMQTYLMHYKTIFSIISFTFFPCNNLLAIFFTSFH